MKRVLAWVFGGFLVLIIGGAFFYLYKKSQAKPVVFKTFPAEQAAQALALVDSNEHIGKIVLPG